MISDNDGAVAAATGTGLDHIVELVDTDRRLARDLEVAAVTEGARAAATMNGLLIDAVQATGVAVDGGFSAADVATLNAHLVATQGDAWAAAYGSDGPADGFHAVLQTENNATRLFDKKAISYVAARLYQIGLETPSSERVANENGTTTALFKHVAGWLDDLLAADLAGGDAAAAPLVDDPAAFRVEPATGTGLDVLVEIIQDDAALARDLEVEEILQGARHGDAMNVLLVDAIRATGVANDGALQKPDLLVVSDHIQAHHGAEWRALHGSAATNDGFHVLTQTENNAIDLFGRKAVAYVADWIWHVGLGYTEDERFVDGNGDPGNLVKQVGGWIGELLADDLAAGTLANPAVELTIEPSTGTGLDVLVELIQADEGLAQALRVDDIRAGARAGDAMNTMLVDAIRSTGVAADGAFDASDLRAVSDHIRDHQREAWIEAHGDHDPETGAAAGFHLLKRTENNSTELFGRKAIDYVADRIWYTGFGYTDDGDNLLNQRGVASNRVDQVAGWIEDLVAEDLADGTLAAAPTDTETLLM